MSMTIQLDTLWQNHVKLYIADLYIIDVNNASVLTSN